ncbi:MAG: hypothetical protein AAF498_15985, partial [Pseudomonadota bacterium]
VNLDARILRFESTSKTVTIRERKWKPFVVEVEFDYCVVFSPTHSLAAQFIKQRNHQASFEVAITASTEEKDPLLKSLYTNYNRPQR